jgi:hypothetical protein
MTTKDITKEPMAYIATKECGCIVASMLKDSIDKKVLGKLVAEWVAAGYNIEFVAHSYVLANWHLCWHSFKQQELSEKAARNAEHLNEQDAETNKSPATATNDTEAAEGEVEISKAEPDLTPTGAIEAD